MRYRPSPDHWGSIGKRFGIDLSWGHSQGHKGRSSNTRTVADGMKASIVTSYLCFVVYYPVVLHDCRPKALLEVFLLLKE